MKEAEIIVEELLTYKNDKNLSWMTVYKKILKKLNLEDHYNNHKLLSTVVTKITRLGYDITDNPFKLDKFV